MYLCTPSKKLSFNPCYNGSGVRSDMELVLLDDDDEVSILVIMEVG